MRVLRAFGRFWYDFVIGDDWKIAAAVLVAVALTVAALESDLFGDTGLCILGAVLIFCAFTISLIVDVRSSRK